MLRSIIYRSSSNLSRPFKIKKLKSLYLNLVVRCSSTVTESNRSVVSSKEHEVEPFSEKDDRPVTNTPFAKELS